MTHSLRALTCCLLLHANGVAGTLYYTDFSTFTAGDNKWAGTAGWISNDNTSGAQGIIADPVAGLPIAKAAYLGYERPANRFTTVFRTVNHNPIASRLPIIHFDSLLGIQDSTNGFRDRFHISFYNIQGDFLAAITFDVATRSLLRDNGTTTTNTGVKFLLGDPILNIAALQILEIQIDLPANRWSAEIDGLPVFTNAVLTATGKPTTLGAVAAEWSVTALSTLAAGDNWLLVTDWLVAAIPAEPFNILSCDRADGATTIRWPGHTGFDYRVFQSPDLAAWHTDLAVPPVRTATEGPISFTDASSPGSPSQFFRVVRAPTR